MEDRVKDHVDSYERPAVSDYGTLQELTLSASSANSDTQGGPNGTAFPPAS